MGVALGSFLGGANEGVQAAQKQMLAEKTQADSVALQSRGLAIQQGQLGVAQNRLAQEKRQASEKAANGVAEQMLKIMDTTQARYADAGHPPGDAEPAIRSLAQHVTDLYSVAGMADKAAAFEDITKAMVSLPAKNTEPKYQPAGVDPATGKTAYAQVNPAAPGGVTAPTNMSSAATDFMPKDPEGNLLFGRAAFDSFSKTDPAIASMIQGWLQGKQPLPSQYQLAKQPQLNQYVAIARQIDPGLDYATAPARFSAAKEWASGKINAPGGQVSGASGAARHFAEYTDNLVKIDNADLGYAILSRGVNTGKNVLAATERQNAIQQATSAAQQWAPEVSKLYTGNVGTGEERQQKVKHITQFTEASVTMGSVALTELRLMLEKSAQLVSDYHTRVTPLFPPPLFTPDTTKAYNKALDNIAKMDPTLAADVATTRAEVMALGPTEQPETMGITAVPPGSGQLPPAGGPAAPSAPAAPAAAAPAAKGAQQQAPAAPSSPQQSMQQLQEMKQDIANAQAYAAAHPDKHDAIMQALVAKYPQILQGKASPQQPAAQPPVQ